MSDVNIIFCGKRMMRVAVFLSLLQVNKIMNGREIEIDKEKGV
jgi:hypothetical protein